MKHFAQRSAAALLALSLFTAPAFAALTDGMKEGAATFKSMGPLAFGPDGILFVADTKSAAVTAIATGDTKAPTDAKALKVEGLNQKIAALLGTTITNILIDDLVVNPLSHNVYVAVSRGRGPQATPVLLRVKTDGALEVVALDKVKFSRGELPDAPIDGVVGQPNRGSNPRQESITDIAFFQDRVLIAGLSNEEFASTLRAIPFPFQTVANGTSVEIYHGAHGKFETRSPIRTFVPFKVGNEPQLIAAYTCTPLVQFPLTDLKPGAKIKGKTIAELGNQNRPLDMIVYQKDGKDFLLIANSSRGIMKISMEGIEQAGSITSQTDVTGQPYETIKEWAGVEQLDSFGSEQAMILRKEGASMLLETLSLP